MIGNSILLLKLVKWSNSNTGRSISKYLCASGAIPERTNCILSQNASRKSHNLSLDTKGRPCQQHSILNNCVNAPFLGNKQSFSTCARNLSIVDKINNFYNFFEKLESRGLALSKNISPAVRLENAAPESWQPYLRLARVDKPTGMWLLYLPCAFSITLAAPLGSLPSLYYLSLFGAGAFLMRGAGCVINDLWDKKIDKEVERTKERPLASGELQTKNAIALLAVQLSLSLGILLSLNLTCVMIGVVAMLPVIVYPLAKRITYFPQLVLGFTFNMGAIMGYAAVTGSINWYVVAPLYIGCISWTLYYDTIYAMQDRYDDAQVGVKSLALLLSSDNIRDRKKFMKMSVGERMSELDSDKNNLNRFLTGTNITTMSMWMLSAYCTGCVFTAYLIPIMQLLKYSNEDHGIGEYHSYWEAFVSSKNVGVAVLLCLIFGVYLAHPKQEINKEEKLAE